ncbi:MULTISPECIES: DUF642 domain-containing protein [unclassified Streptomyces]|jgi:hypothetical protein|uniref:DUF642 domain-containing protein n=1 Tax=unclassified Streptomyces TaxID=2593676 RepID=UPI003678D2E3
MNRPRLVVVTALSSALLAGLALVPATFATASTNLVTNGTFSKPDVERGAATYKRVTSANSDQIMTGWRVTKGSVDIFSSQTARYRHQAANINGGGNGSIQQDLETDSGQRYKLEWYHSPETWDGCESFPDQPYDVSLDGSDVEPKRFEPTGDPGTYRKRSLTFTAESDFVTLSFTSKAPPSNGHCGALIADVVVKPVANSNNNGNSGGNDTGGNGDD